MKGYRPNVCAVILNKTGKKVLVFRRADQILGGQIWQFPQGGLNPGESPPDGMLRELAEEIGTADVTTIKQSEHPIRYDFPEDVRQRIAEQDVAKAGYIGQEQYWFLLRLNVGIDAINFDFQPAEFNAFRWATPQQAVEMTVAFKTEAYREGLSALGLLKD